MIHCETQNEAADEHTLSSHCLEALQYKDHLAQWGSLIHGLIHNVNGPLQNMSMLVEILGQMQSRLDAEIQKLLPHPLPDELNELSEKNKKRMQQLGQQVQLLGDMLHDFIALNEMEQNDTEVDVPLLLTQLTRVYRANLFFKHHVQLELDLTADLPHVRIPGRALVPSFVHLIDNALNALKTSQEKRLTIRCYPSSSDIRVEFKDTGCGLPPECSAGGICTLFHPRWSDDNQKYREKNRKHFGLGLFITQKLLNPYGVRVFLTSDQAETVVTVSIPTP